MLALSLFLPWYQKTLVVDGDLAQGNVSALGAFTFVEAAILLDCVGGRFLVWARSRQKGFHLPGGDGVAIMLAGGWAVLLILFTGRSTSPTTWASSGACSSRSPRPARWSRRACACARCTRPSRRTRPPTTSDWVAPPRRERERAPDRRPRDATAVTEMLRDRPAWEGDVPDPSRAETTRLPDPSEAPTRRERRPDEEKTQRLWEDESNLNPRRDRPRRPPTPASSSPASRARRDAAV